jgi:hypothetical protein
MTTAAEHEREAACSRPVKARVMRAGFCRRVFDGIRIAEAVARRLAPIFGCVCLQIFARNTEVGSASPRSALAATASINPLNSYPCAFNQS